MRVRATAATAALLLAALTACGDGDGGDSDKGDSAPETVPTRVEKSGTIDESQTMALGEPAKTTGDGGKGALEITPDTIVFAKEGGGETSANGVFAVVTMKDKATTAVAADEPAPISGGGWKWMAPDGETIGFDSGNSSNVVMDKYNNEDPVQPGGYQWRARVFDLTPAQAKGGTLIYIDGGEKAFRWKMPATDAGPSVAEVKKQLEF